MQSGRQKIHFRLFDCHPGNYSLKTLFTTLFFVKKTQKWIQNYY